MSRKKLILLPALLLLISLTACKTVPVYIVPSITEPVLKDEPTHDKWTFTLNPDGTYSLSATDLKTLTKYIIDLKGWGENNRYWVQYYIDELNRLKAENNSESK